MRILGLIPARSGSTRVPEKNVRPFHGGESLLVRTIRTCLASRLDRVILSTDSKAYADLGRSAGAEVPFLRPAVLASAEASAMSVVRHCLRHFHEAEGYRPDAVAYLQPTSPFRTARHIDEGIALLKRCDADTVLSLEPVRQHPVFMWRFDEARKISQISSNLTRVERSQDLSPVYLESTVIIISRTSYLESAEDGSLIMNHDSFEPLLVDSTAAIDINTEEDFAYAEFIAARRKAGERTDIA